MKECTFKPKISSSRQFEQLKSAPKGYVESIARVRSAFNRKQEIKQVQSNMGKYNPELRLAEQQRVNGRLVPEPFKFQHSAQYSRQLQRKQREEVKQRREQQAEEKRKL